MKSEIEEQVKSYLNEHGEATTAELSAHIRNINPLYTTATVTTYLSRLVAKGAIFTSGRGMYTSSSKPKYEPDVTQRIKLMANKIRTEYPLLTFCIWDSGWLNEFMRHQLFRYMMVIEVEKDGAESVFYRLSETSKKVFLAPDSLFFERYISSYDDPVIIMPLISEAPLAESSKIPVPSLEKLLVDMVAEKNLFGAQQAELDFIYSNAFEKYRLSTYKIKRYAKRRNQLKKVAVLIEQAEEDLRIRRKR